MFAAPTQPETYLEPCQTSKMKRFLLDVRQGSEFASANDVNLYNVVTLLSRNSNNFLRTCIAPPDNFFNNYIMPSVSAKETQLIVLQNMCKKSEIFYQRCVSIFWKSCRYLTVLMSIDILLFLLEMSNAHW